jgi:hypothetical protein
MTDTTVPVSGRIWNYWMGGKDYFPIDKEVGDQFTAIYPGIVDLAKGSRNPEDNDDYVARSIVDRLKEALPSGGYLALYEDSNIDDAHNEAMRLYNESGAVPYRLREPEQIVRFFDGLEPVEPGVVPMQQWRPDDNPFNPSKDLTAWAGAAKKP